MKSFYGGVISLILTITVSLFFLMQLAQIFMRTYAETATKNVVEDIHDDQTLHFIGLNGFAIGISYVDYAHNPSILHNYLADDTYFSVKFFEVNRVRNPNKTYTFETNTFEMSN